MKPIIPSRVLVLGLILAAASAPIARDFQAARAKARRLVRQIRADLGPVEDQIRNAPFIAQVEDGRASLAKITDTASRRAGFHRVDRATSPHAVRG